MLNRVNAMWVAMFAAMAFAGAAAAPAFAQGSGPQSDHSTASAHGDAGKHAVVRLEGSPETTQFGWFNNSQQPVARIHSGDTVVMETLIHGDKQVIMNEMTIEQMTARARKEQAE